LFVQPLDLVR